MGFDPAWPSLAKLGWVLVETCLVLTYTFNGSGVLLLKLWLKLWLWRKLAGFSLVLFSWFGLEAVAIDLLYVLEVERAWALIEAWVELDAVLGHFINVAIIDT